MTAPAWGRLRELEMWATQQRDVRSRALAQEDRGTAGLPILSNEPPRPKGARFDWQSFVTVAAKFRVSP